jgi:hypothetical protein
MCLAKVTVGVMFMLCRIGWVLLLFPQWVVAGEMRFSYGVESFLWEEFDTGGVKLLDESGFRHVFKLAAESVLAPTWQSDLSAHVTFGTVAYDGQAQSGTPVSSDTEYSGYGLEVGISYFPGQIPAGENAGAGVRLALGMDAWDRTLLGSGGYRENYRSTYGRAAAVYMVSSVWRVELGAKLPVNTSERVDLSAYGYVDEVNLNPKGQPSLYVTWHYQINERFGFNLNYDGYRFNRSDDDIIYNILDGNYYAVHQPRSEMQTLGLVITISF